MKLFCKIKSKRGFSIGELLVAILILSMVSAVVAGGIPVARDAYLKVTIGANSQVLLSTAISELRNELGTASSVVNLSATEIAYISGNTGSISKLYIGDDGITIEEYAFNPVKPDLEEAVKGTPLRTRVLVPKTPAPDNLYVKYDGANVSNGIVTITNLKVKRGSESEEYAGPQTIMIRVIRK